MESNSFGILLISSYKSFFDGLSPVLKAMGFNNQFFASDTTQAQKLLMTNDISAIIINSPLKDDLGLELAVKYSSVHSSAVLMSVSTELFRQVSEKTEEYGIFTLPSDTDTNTLIQSLLVFFSAAEKIKKLKTAQKDRLSETTQLKLISRAKMILISNHGMSEEQAHKYIERRAMESRKTKTAIAESIIKSYGNRG